MTGIVSICIILACTFILMCVAFLMLRNEMMDSDDDGDEKTYWNDSRGTINDLIKTQVSLDETIH